jgi:hypothetical protein
MAAGVPNNGVPIVKLDPLGRAPAPSITSVPAVTIVPPL